MSQLFIIDEWLWADLNGENGENKQLEAINFLETLLEKCDRIAVAKCSKFQKKERDFSKRSSNDVIKRIIAVLYFSKIRSNSQKYKEIDIKDVKEIESKEINPDDIYLVKTYCKTKAPIITTDTKLINALKKMDIPYKFRDEFLKEYVQNTLSK